MEISIETCRKAVRELRMRLNQLLGVSGTYKTTSSWSSVRYVELTYNLIRMEDDNGDLGTFTIEYNKEEVEDIFNEICQKYGFEFGRYGLDMYDDSIEARFYSHEPSYE